MCGRTSVFIPLETLEERFDASHATPAAYEPRYNISPGSTLPVLTNVDSDAIEVSHTIEEFHWGLLPPWAEELEEGHINARSETAAEKPTFRAAWEERPCLVPSTGFYEWQAHNGGPKTPYRIYREDDVAFAMAGLWQRVSVENTERATVTILTTAANDLIEPIHDRMPVILPRDRETEWLEADPSDRQELCQPYPNADLDTYEISTRVNDPGNDDPAVIEPASTRQSGLGDFSA